MLVELTINPSVAFEATGRSETSAWIVVVQGGRANCRTGRKSTPLSRKPSAPGRRPRKGPTWRLSRPGSPAGGGRSTPRSKRRGYRSHPAPLHQTGFDGIPSPSMPLNLRMKSSAWAGLWPSRHAPSSPLQATSSASILHRTAECDPEPGLTPTRQPALLFGFGEDSLLPPLRGEILEVKQYRIDDLTSERLRAQRMEQSRRHF